MATVTLDFNHVKRKPPFMMGLMLCASLLPLLMGTLLAFIALVVGQAQPTWEQVVYISGQDRGDIYSIEVDRGIPVRLLDGFGIADARFLKTNSPIDSRQLLFAMKSDRNLLTFDLETGRLNPFLDAQSELQESRTYPMLSPDGTRIAYMSRYQEGGGWQLYVQDTSQNTHRKISEISYTNLSWSPDSKLLAFAIAIRGDMRALLRIANAYTGEVVREIITEVEFSGGLAWSPDGDRILYVSRVEDFPENYDIFSLDLSTGQSHNLSAFRGVDAAPMWSPDGTHIAFHSNRNRNYDIYIMNADGAEVRPITTHGFDDLYPVWSPDGGRIVFRANLESSSELYITDADGNNVRRLTQNRLDDADVIWRPCAC